MVFSLHDSSILSKHKFITMLINDKPIKFQIYTASDILLISIKNWKYLDRPHYNKTSHIAKSASGETIDFPSMHFYF